MKKHSIKSKQNNSKNCVVCGIGNDLSLKARFYETENDELVALFTPQEHHQSYPNIMHGGMSSAILDEVIGRAIMSKYKDQVWGVTVELNLRYKKPVPLYKELKVVGRITKERGPIFEGTGEIFLPNGEVAVTATGKYLKMSIDKISPGEFSDSEWFLMEDESEVHTIDV
ncbi:MAG: PaaI family thioesterase [Spirochaetales bacterium]|nr:PaaI family thioesterase [Spirochaetales bacterium]